MEILFRVVRRKGLQSLPAKPETVAVFIFTQGIGGKKPNTLRGYASSIAAEHRSEGHDSPAPTGWPWSSRVSSTGPRKRASAKTRQTLTGEDLEKIRETAATRERPTGGWSVSPMPDAAAWWTLPSSR